MNERLLYYLRIVGFLAATFGMFGLNLREYRLPPTHQIKNEVATVNNGTYDLTVFSLRGNRARIQIGNSNKQWVQEGHTYNLTRDFHIGNSGQMTVTKITPHSIRIHLNITYLQNRYVDRVFLTIFSVFAEGALALLTTFIWSDLIELEKQLARKRKRIRLKRRQNPYGMQGDFELVWMELASLPLEDAKEQRKNLQTLWTFYCEMDDTQKRIRQAELNQTLNHMLDFVKNIKEEKGERFSSFAESIRRNGGNM